MDPLKEKTIEKLAGALTKFTGVAGKKILEPTRNAIKAQKRHLNMMAGHRGGMGIPKHQLKNVGQREMYKKYMDLKAKLPRG